MAMHEIKKAMEDVKAVHAMDRNSQPSKSRNQEAHGVEGTPQHRNSPTTISDIQLEERGRTRTADRQRSRSRSPINNDRRM
jgi:hypothetical protein